MRREGSREKPVVEIPSLPRLVPEAAIERLTTMEDILLESKGVHGGATLAGRETGGWDRWRGGGSLPETVSNVRETSLDER